MEGDTFSHFRLKKDMILVMGGTSEARDLVNDLDASNIVYTTVSRNQAHLARFHQLPRIHLVGPLDCAQLVATINNNGIKKLVDATHPFAVEASLNAIAACGECSIPYFRFERPRVNILSSDLIRIVPDFDEAVRLIQESPDTERMLLSIGVNHLAPFQKLIRDPAREVYCQVLDSPSSMELAQGYGFLPDRILTVQGVPQVDDIRRRLNQLHINMMVFKESGYRGGTNAKIKAGCETKTPMIIIDRPKVNYPAESFWPE